MSSVKGLEEMISGYNNTLSNTLDIHAPEVDRTVILRPHAPWKGHRKDRCSTVAILPDRKPSSLQTQAAYRPFHSVETALLKVQNDILTALDKRKEALLVLLDFSAAFDTLDHRQLLDHFEERYGLRGNVLNWFSSDLADRTQSVAINEMQSDPMCFVWSSSGIRCRPFGVYYVQRAITGLDHAHGVQSVVYADDTQLYLTFQPQDRDMAVRKLEACISDIRSWCKVNKLVLNDSKTELVHLYSKFKNTSWTPSMTIGDFTIRPSPQARNLGVSMDSVLSMSSHVDNLCKSALLGIRKIGRIRQYLTRKSTTKLVHAFVTSKLDTCNSLLYGLPDREIAKVQKVQNVAARLVLRISRHEHVTPALEELHWLPIKQRVAYKIMLVTYNSSWHVTSFYI
ncbi:uncharacterized protein [Amphiura filiformis]|uniref:uncharacterized protein n=1 Tax=Amphiura filiformis TaxID=82378 RepID=UPI003B2170D7